MLRAGADGSVSTDAFLQLLSMLTDGLPNTLATSLMQVGALKSIC